MTNPLEPDAPAIAQGSPVGNESSLNQRAGTRFTVQDELFVFSSLMLITCCFLPWRVVGAEPTFWRMLSSAFPSAASMAFIFLFILWCMTPFTVFLPRVRPWFGIATAISVNGLVTFLAILPGQVDYGALLARVFALGLLVLSANPAILTAGDLAMRRMNSQNADIFHHWVNPVPGIHFSAQDFYAKVENDVRARQWPGVEFVRVLHTEAGLFSHKREYLRVLRQRQVFDLCAATFGKDYFFTLREAELKAQLTLPTLVIFLVALLVAFTLCLSAFGSMLGPICFGLLITFGVLLLWNVLRMGLTRLDGLLMRTPVIGPIYETWFRRSTTYFQHDTRVVFLKLMDDLVKAEVDKETSAKGIELLSCLEHQPIFDGFYKTSKRKPKGGDAK
jgi:hypothetical protein